MKKWAVSALLFIMVSGGVASAQDDPCAGLELAPNEVGLNYEGHCIAAETDRGPVQTVAVQVTENLDGVQSALHIVVIHTLDGWVIAEQLAYQDTNVSDVDLMDSGYIVVDGDQ